jgi:protein-S-isoprenylcysteine O-methyltransferase Ste14
MPVRIARAFASPAILGMVTKIYIPMLFPITFLIWLVASTIDGWLGLEDGFLSSPTNYCVAAAFFVSGAVWWLWTYEQLTRMGEGSPSPTAGRTQKLVVRGIYAYCRNPSIWGKLFGVWAVGIAMNSATFVFVLVPLLVAGSLIEKVVRQEPQLVDVFGPDYEAYRTQVPLFVPWGIVFPSRRYQGPIAD